jgi:hypothetical protein
MLLVQQRIDFIEKLFQCCMADWLFRHVFADSVNVPLLIFRLFYGLPQLVKLLPLEYAGKVATKCCSEIDCLFGYCFHLYTLIARVPGTADRSQ